MPTSLHPFLPAPAILNFFQFFPPILLFLITVPLMTMPSLYRIPFLLHHFKQYINWKALP